MCEGRFYLPYLQQQLQQYGVSLVQQRIRSLEVCLQPAMPKLCCSSFATAIREQTACAGAWRV